MSLTITGGITLSSGGWTISPPPPSQPTASWFSGATFDRVTYATDTATASVRGPLALPKGQLGAAGNLNYGYYAGGTPGQVSTVQRITYATDTATTSYTGPLSLARRFLAGAGNTNYGWFIGGYTGSVVTDTIDRIDYANDTATASVRGPLASARYRTLASFSTSSYAWYCGGVLTLPTINSNIQRIDFASDTATASIRGVLTTGLYSGAATANTTYGWVGGGGFPGGPSQNSLVNRITIANDTATASIRGPLSADTYLNAASGNDTYGWFAGGGSYPNYFSTVNRITYATDTATAGVRGPLSAVNAGMASTSGVQ